MAKTRKPDIIPGQYVGMLRVIAETRAVHLRGRFWLCRCACGTIKPIYAGHLKSGNAVACGCVKGAKRVHGMKDSPEHKCWSSMKERCTNPNNSRYSRYGGRGIKVDPRWMNDFLAFFKDMGPRPSVRYSLDRIDNDGDYTAQNCRWATSRQQNNNRSINRFVRLSGKRLTVAQASRATGIPHARILGRLNRGWPDEEAVK